MVQSNTEKAETPSSQETAERAARTPTPWHVAATAHTELVMAFKENSECVVAELDTDDVSMEESQANAAFIIKAANNHAALIEILDECRLQLEYIHEKHGYSTTEATLARIRHVLSEANL